MPTSVLLPQLGFAMSEGELTEWFAEDGAAVEAGQPLFSIESDKSVNEIESPASGVLKILKSTGETYQVGTLIGEIT